MTIHKIKAIFFDFGQTLIQLSTLTLCMQNSLKKYIPRLPMDSQRFVQRWGQETYKIFSEYRNKSFIDTKEIHCISLKRIFQHENIQASDNQIHCIVDAVWQEYIKNNMMYPDAMPILKQLQKMNYILGIITDCDVDVANGILEKHHLQDILSIKVLSGEKRIYKPNKVLFLEALHQAQCSPDEAIYIGDTEVDIKGAKDVGLRTIIVNRSEISDPICIEPDYRIQSLWELPSLISILDIKKYQIN